MHLADKFDVEQGRRPSLGSYREDDTQKAIATVSDQISHEKNNSIQYRTCSWQKTAALLFSEYICLAILSFPWSYSVLGIVPGVIVTIAVAASVQYTSLILWRFCMMHPEVRDVCDIGRLIFGGSQLAYNATAVMFILNNTFIQALHCLVGAELLNTLTNSSRCTIIFSAITAIICCVVSLPRTLNQLSGLGTFSAGTMGISVVLAIVFAGVQSHPDGFFGESPTVSMFAPKGTTFVSGMSAFLNISYTFIGQITLPSFIAEMKDPKDFPKALWTYMTAPAFGSLQPTFKKIAFSFAIPTIIYLGALYSSVSARFIFFRLFADSAHRHSHTITGWASWIGILAITWVFAFVIAEVIPFFSDMLSLMSSLFDGWFGFIFWGMAYLLLYPPKRRWIGVTRSMESMLNYLIIVFGFFVLIAGTYVSIQSIINSYHSSAVGSVFSCASNGI